MKKVFKNRFILMIMVMVFSIGTHIFAANVGEALNKSEDGWKRFEQTDPLITYIGDRWFENNGYDHLTDDKKAKIKICFKGTGIRILAFTWDNRADQKINIDNVISDTYISSQAWLRNRIVYEKQGLSNGVHYVEIENVGNNILFGIDAIDIQNGEIIKYVEPTITTTNSLSILLQTNENIQLSVTNDLIDNVDLDWTSSDDTVASVDSSGKVTALREGDVSIKAKNTDGSYEEEILIKILGEKEVKELRLAVHLQPNESKRLYLNNDYENITWKSMDESIATVSSEGKVTGVSTGLVLITAEYKGETYVCYVRVA